MARGRSAAERLSPEAPATIRKHSLAAPRRSEAGQWAGGAMQALATIALSALMVWLLITAVNAAGLLPRPAPHTPDAGDAYAERAFG
jgi:hypothetical protein